MVDTSAAPARNASRPAIVLFTIGILCFWAAMYVYVPIQGVYAEQLGASKTVVGLVVGVYGLTQLLTRIPLGILSDVMGRRKAFVVAGMVICGIAAVGLALSPTPAWLVVFRGVMGLAAATWVCSTVLFTSYFPNSHAAVPLSIMSFTSAVGQVLATSLGGELAQRVGWTAPFWASLVLSMGAFVVLALAPEDVTVKRQGTTVASMMKTARAPLLVLACVMGAVIYFAGFSTVYGFTPVYAEERFGANAAQLGYLTTAALVAYSIVTILSSRIVQRLGELRSLLLGLAVFAVAVLLTSAAPNLGVLTVLHVFNGMGRGLLYPLLMSLAIKAATAQDRGSAMGIFQAAYAAGMFVGPWLSGSVADSLGTDAVFILCGGLLLVALALAAYGAPRAMARSQV